MTKKDELAVGYAKEPGGTMEIPEEIENNALEEFCKKLGGEFKTEKQAGIITKKRVCKLSKGTEVDRNIKLEESTPLGKTKEFSITEGDDIHIIRNLKRVKTTQTSDIIDIYAEGEYGEISLGAVKEEKEKPRRTVIISESYG